MQRNLSIFDLFHPFRNIAVLEVYFKHKAVENWLRSPMIRFDELIGKYYTKGYYYYK